MNLLRRLAICAAAAAVAVGSPAATGRAAEPLSSGVVEVESNLGYAGAAGAGTGMVLTSSGEVLTNNHVIRGATTIRVTIPQTGKRYTARVLGYSISADVALLKLQGASGLQTVSVGDSSKVKVGQTATAVGNAGGTGTLVTTAGRITGVGRSITVGDEQGGRARLTGLIRTDAELQPGDSGGPLFAAGRRVIGMNTAASARFDFGSGDSEGYAIPINRAMTIVRQIESGDGSSSVHVGATAFLGVGVQATSSSSSGVLVTGVASGSPASRAGLAAGDTITSVAGHPLRTRAALVAELLSRQPGDTVSLVWTNQLGRRATAQVTLAAGPPQ
jgi:S1-C subfamily serine protease